MLHGAETTTNPSQPAKKESSDWVFSILPKSLQKNPRLELTVITEMTDAGKSWPPVSAGKPAYLTFSPPVRATSGIRKGARSP